MRVPAVAAAFAAFATALAAGCNEPKHPFDGPTVEAYDGRLLHDGKPVSFPSEQGVVMDLIHEKGSKFGIPIHTDGTFKIGWMPVGKYTASLVRSKPAAGNRPGANAAPQMGYPIPGGTEIKEGQQEYAIELGKGWKP